MILIHTFDYNLILNRLFWIYQVQYIALMISTQCCKINMSQLVIQYYDIEG